MSEEQQIDAEAEARKFGWRPKEDFVNAGNDEAKWRDAPEFLEYREQLQPTLIAQNKDLKRQLAEVNARYTGLEGTVADLARAQRERMTEEFTVRENFLKQQIREARKVGDFETAADREESLEQLREKKPAAEAKPEEAAKPQTDAEGFTPEGRVIFDAWREKNTWWDENKKLQRLGAAMATEVSRENPGLQGRAFMDTLAARLREEYPDEFEETPAKRTRAGNSVEGSSFGRRSTAGTSYEKLPADAKKECDSFVSRGLGTREKYMKMFNDFEE